MSDVDKHFDTARRLARHQAEREWLRAAYETLERQKSVLGALLLAEGSIGETGIKAAEWRARMRQVAASIVIAQCDSIMRHSGMDAGELAEIADPAEGDQAEAREETLPW